MRLDFNVLWVDDQPNAVASTRVSIERQIKKEGFRLQVEFAKSLVEADSYLSADIYGDHIDLILMDYDLGVGGYGDEGLKNVRNKFPYKDVIFYSSAVSDLSTKVSQANVQGIYCSSREHLPGTVVGAFEALVKKVIDIDHSRGIVMGATSDIDQHINDCLFSVYQGSNEANKALTLNVLKRHVSEKRENFKRNADSTEAITQLTQLHDMHNFYTSNDRLRLLKNALKINAIHDDKLTHMDSYMKSTVPQRNDLAHLKVETKGFSRKLFNKKGIEFTSDDMKKLRVELLNHQEVFEKLADAVTKSS